MGALKNMADNGVLPQGFPTSDCIYAHRTLNTVIIHEVVVGYMFVKQVVFTGHIALRFHIFISW